MLGIALAILGASLAVGLAGIGSALGIGIAGQVILLFKSDQLIQADLLFNLGLQVQ